MACFAGTRARRRPVEDALHRRDVVALAHVGLERGDADELRRHHVHVRHLLGFDEAKECLGVEALHQHDGLRARERLQRVAVSRAVVEREAREVHLVGVGEAPEVEQRRVRTRAVGPGPGAGGADDGLGPAGRARRVHTRRDQVGRRRARDGLRRTARRARARTRRPRGAWARCRPRVRRDRSRAAPRRSRGGGSRARRWSTATTPAPAARRAARSPSATSTHSGRLPSTVATGASGPTPRAGSARANWFTRAVELPVGDAAVVPDQRDLVRVGCRRRRPRRPHREHWCSPSAQNIVLAWSRARCRRRHGGRARAARTRFSRSRPGPPSRRLRHGSVGCSCRRRST